MNLLLLKYFDRIVGRLMAFVIRIFIGISEIIRPNLEKVDVDAILLTKLWGIGNIVMILPIIKGIRERYPDAKIFFLTLEMNRDLLDHNQYLDGVYVFSVASFGKFIQSSLRLLRALRRQRVDIFLDFEQFSHLTSVFGVLIGAKHKVGLLCMNEGRGRLYNLRVPFDDGQHMRRTFFDVARSIGVRASDRLSGGLEVSVEGSAEVARLLGADVSESDMLLGMHIGASDNFPGKRWPKEHFAALADALADKYDARIVFTGSAMEARMIDHTIGLMHNQAINTAGHLSINGLIAIIDRCALFFSNDTAPVHIASALNAPIVAFYGPATPDNYGPTSDESLVFYKDLPCSPCITNFNAKTSFCRIPVCMEGITVEEVVEGVRQKFGAHLAGADSRRHR